MIGPDITRITSQKTATTPATLQIDVIADLVCPWSFLGKKRLDDALEAVRGPSLVSWYPFQINPTMPDDGMTLDAYLASKFGDPAELQPKLDELTRKGHQEGIAFRFDRLQRVPNTLNAHCVMNVAENQKADVSGLADRLLRAYFERGLDISDEDVLIDVAAESNIRSDDVRTAIRDERTRQIVLSQESQVRKSGVTGVPDFLVNKRLFVVGAHHKRSLVDVFDRAMFGAESDLPVSATIH